MWIVRYFKFHITRFFFAILRFFQGPRRFCVLSRIFCILKFVNQGSNVLGFLRKTCWKQENFTTVMKLFKLRCILLNARHTIFQSSDCELQFTNRLIDFFFPDSWTGINLVNFALHRELGINFLIFQLKFTKLSLWNRKIESILEFDPVLTNCDL